MWDNYQVRDCNGEEVPFVTCESKCCKDCNNVYSCMYVCSDLDCCDN